MVEARIGERAHPAVSAIGGLFLVSALFAIVAGPSFAAGVLAPLLAAGGLAILQPVLTGKSPSLAEAALDCAVIAAFVAARDETAQLWQFPAQWSSLVALSTPGAVISCALYFASALTAQVRTHRHLTLAEAVAILLAPILFNLVLGLGADGLMRQLGGWLTFGAVQSDGFRATAGRAAMLAIFVEALVGILRVLTVGRFSGNWRLHALLFVSAIHAALTPMIADLAQAAAGAGALVEIVLATLAAALAQAGLWALVFVVTGLAIDCLSGTPPIFVVAYRHWRHGFLKGAIYGGAFMFLLLAAAAFLRSPTLVHATLSAPFISAAIGGALLFPLAKTVVASADGTAPFFGRLIASYRDPRSYMRGVVVGLAAALALTSGFCNFDGWSRVGALFLAGALAYAGVDLAFDLGELVRRRRQLMETWRTYALGFLLGGLVGAALGWYFDATQIEVVRAKFWSYADLGYQASGRPIRDMVVYPWFSKWGRIDLGPVGGGVRLFFDESLSGVINWAIAAPLFSINFFFLAAIFQRSLSPLKKLFSPVGFQGLFEQTIRVLRWGLWMAPVINSFLRPTPDPSWFNQDGGVRTVAASLANLVMPAGDFRAASLSVFTGLLAYDWLRVVIWLDHMGLRVATLVNLTFIGGDRTDEAMARFAGYPARTRVIPDGIRRFATWTPLLIPFYIPRGADWDAAWTGAEHLRAAAAPLPMPVAGLLAAYVAAACGACAAAILIAQRWSRQGAAAGPPMPGVPRAVTEGPARFSLSDGLMGLELLSDGRGYSQVSGMARGGGPIDMTRRPTDALQLRGRFFYLRDEASETCWSIGYEPARTAGPDYSVTAPRPDRLRIVNSFGAVRAEAEICLAEDKCVELWRIRLTDLAGRPRRLLLTSFQELALNEPGSYVRDPDFSGMHIETGFVPEISAIFARNRLLHDPATRRMSKEVAFHAVAAARDGLRLTGYEDSRTRFIGTGDLRHPQGLDPDRPRHLDDQGSLYTFDPAASFTIAVDLPANGSREILFVNGHAGDAVTAARLVATHLGIATPSETDLRVALDAERELEPLPPPPASAWPFAFSPAGTELRLTHKTPRPWAHVLASASGFGAVVSNEGEIHSFAGNERQNAVTPFRFESVAASLPGQLIYVVDLATGEADTAGYVPYRRADATYDVTYGLGAAVFRNTRRDIELELTIFAPPSGSADVRLLTIRNRTDAAKTFRIAPYFDIALAESPAESLGCIETAFDDATGALLFANPANDFVKGWAFAATSLTGAATETIRARFIGGKGRDLTNPVMVETGAADGSRDDDGRRVAAFAAVATIPGKSEIDVVVALGQTATRDQAGVIASQLCDPAAARLALKATRAAWDERLKGIHIETNNPAFDRLVNHWLPYQVLVSRLWGRTGPNQRGGAIGFRDQLQDVLPFLFLDPGLARQQILLHAGQQFPEGDVLKWWHKAPDGRTGVGQRTRASDPHLWLPYVVTRYLAATGDASVLGEQVAYLEGAAIPEGSLDLFLAPRASRVIGDVQDHCVRAIDYCLARMGAHGLPLIGTGDWNDGIDRAGVEGRGESVWLGFFLHGILMDFSKIACGSEGESAARRYRAEADRLKPMLERAWLGERYALAFDDSGLTLDHASAMTAAWPILSGAVDFARGRAALENGLAQLEKADRILLLTPPFDERASPYPGRIADYPPGVRENGGQYSHGVSWTVDAYVRLAQIAQKKGDLALAAQLKARAFACWIKISPIGKTEGAQLAVYGLAPHQQPADIYDGAGHAGRGGWSWYTGAAARMLSSAYAILGLDMKNGEIIAPDDLFAPKGPLQVKAIHLKGRSLKAGGTLEHIPLGWNQSER